MTPEEGLNLVWSTLFFLFTATVYVMTHSSVVLLKVMSILFPRSHPHLQPAPRARLLSLCTVTLESFRVSLSMALRRPGYSDWSIGYMPEGQKHKGRSAHIRTQTGLFIYLESTDCTNCTLWWNTTCTEGVLRLTACPMILQYSQLVFSYVMSRTVSSIPSCLITILSDSKKHLKTRTFLTSKHHGFGRFKPWKSFHRLLLEVECVTNLGLFHILHPCYDVAHLACKPTRQSWKVTLMQSKQASQWTVGQTIDGTVQ